MQSFSNETCFSESLSLVDQNSVYGRLQNISRHQTKSGWESTLLSHQGLIIYSPFDSGFLRSVPFRVARYCANFRVAPTQFEFYS